MKRNLIYLAIIFMLLGCAVSNVVMKPNYFLQESRVGLMVVTNPIEYDAFVSGSRGAFIREAITGSATEKYEEAVKVLKKKFNNSEKIKDFYLETFRSKGKKISEIEENILAFDVKRKSYKIDHASLQDFKSPKGSDKYYFKVDCVDHFCKKDIRYLKEKFQIDELIIVFVQYSFQVVFLYGAEVSKHAAISIDTEVVDLNDNSVIFKNEAFSRVECIENWNTPPEYKNMRDGMYTSIEEAIGDMKEELFKATGL